MARFKWYDIFVDLFGITLSITDPITDILTLVEFYRADHKTWFVVGLCFIILPLVFFLFINFAHLDEDDNRCGGCTTCIFGCSPFFPAVIKLRTLFVHLKKLPNLWRGNQIEPTDINENPLTDLDKLLDISASAVLAEAAFESAPQFIIQLYAMVVQQESVTIVQMVSLPVSFLSLASASTVADTVKLLHRDRRDLNLSRLRVVPHFSSRIVERAKRERAWKSPRRVSPFLAWGDFHARSRFAPSTILEEKWGTTRSLES